MWDGKFSKSKAIFLALSLVAGGGCDSNIGSHRASEPLARADNPRPVEWYEARPNVLRARLDAARGRIWALHVDGIDVYDAASDAKLRSIALPEWIWASELHSCPPDVAIGPNGDVVVTSNVVPVVWRIDAASFQVSRHDLVADEHKGREVGFSALTYSAQQGAFLAMNGLDGSLWRIDASLRRAQHIPLSVSIPRACSLGARAGAAGKSRPGALCVQAEASEWTIHLAPDYRSGYAHRGQCSMDRLASRTPAVSQNNH